MKKRRSLAQDVRKIDDLQTEIELTKRRHFDLRREIEALHGQRTRAINALRIAGEGLASRGAIETARFCRFTADEISPADCAMSVGIGVNEEGRR